MAVGDEGPHAAWLGQGQHLAVVGLAALRIESVGVARDVAEVWAHEKELAAAASVSLPSLMVAGAGLHSWVLPN
jgi:hypothetical protein